jgi:exosome complex component MTR3
VHVEAALRGVIIGERWPKSGVEVAITILEADEDGWWGDGGKAEGSGWGLLNVLAGCITVASAAIADAGIDCVDLVSGGVAALVRQPNSNGNEDEVVKVLDPSPAEHQDIVAACAVGYLAGRDEITEIWMKGDMRSNPDDLIEGATYSALGSLSVLKEVLLESVQAKFAALSSKEGEDEGQKTKSPSQQDVEMTG